MLTLLEVEKSSLFLLSHRASSNMGCDVTAGPVDRLCSVVSVHCLQPQKHSSFR